MFRNIFKNFSLLLILIFVFLIIVCPLVKVQAQPPPGSIENPLNADSFTELFVGIANWVAGFVSALAVLVVVIGGLQYMISGGNEEKTKAARRNIQWALIGLIIVLMSWSLLQTLLTILGVG